MGQYINPPDMTKEAWLTQHATEVEPVYPLGDVSQSLICLVDNGLFTAAAVVFDEREWREFTDREDPRSKRWFVVPSADLEGVIR